MGASSSPSDGAPGISVVIDARDPEALAPFRAAALGYVVEGAVGGFVALVPDGRPGPNLLLQRVPEAKASKNRVHLDIKVPDVEGLVARLEGLGATRAGTGAVSELGATWIVMTDPEGNEFGAARRRTGLFRLPWGQPTSLKDPGVIARSG